MRIRVFKEQNTLEEMLSLRRQGWTYEQLAEKYQVDKSSIYHWCVLYGLDGKVIRVVRDFFHHVHGLPVKITVQENIWIDDPIEGKVKKGKSYKEYLKERDQRQSHSKL